ncbi:MAG: serine/threonine-protein kinase [Acidobacteriota bacterium]
MAAPPAPPTETLDSSNQQSSPALERGTTIGRYVVLALAGEGAHGRVYAAWDPQLDRKVALKVLRSPDSDRARRRLLREAKALAQLTHPNVLPVYDAGSEGSQVYLATELVEGLSLNAWLAEGRRSRRHILQAFLAAGRGLAAAHREGIVHGDFKPGNVMLGHDGRPRVVDFGLARRRLESEEPRGPGPSPGTPAFMAPELVAGAGATASSDQFAVCVALWRALGGAHPLDEPTSREAIPKRLRALLERGLRTDPQERWPDLEALLDALEEAPRTTRWLGAAGVGLGLLALGLVAGQRQSRDRDLCSGSRAMADSVWSASQRAAVQERLAAQSSPALATTTGNALDRRLDSWVEQRTEACRATHQRGEQSAGLLDLRMACLDRRLAETAALVRLLATADRPLADRAPLAISGLPPLASCADNEALNRLVMPQPQPDQQAPIGEVRRLLAETVAHTEAGRWERGLELARQAEDAAAAIGFRPLSAEAHLRRGILEELQTEPEAAEASLTRALFAAQAGRDDRTAVEAFTHLARVVGYLRSQPDRGLTIASEGKALLALIGQRQALAAELAAVEGALYNRRGDLGRAVELQQRALELQTDLHGADHPKVGRSLARLANARARQGDAEAAEALTRQAAEVYQSSLGADHPRLIALLTNLGNFRFQDGDYDAAESVYRRALELSLQHHGETHPKTAALLASRANLELTRGRAGDALENYREALAIYRQRLGEEHPISTAILTNLGSAHLELGQSEQARRAYRQALEITTARDGEESLEVASLIYNLAEVDRRNGQPGRALPQYDRALELWAAAVPADDPLLAYAHTGRGEALIDLGRPRQAIPHLERALELRQKEGDSSLRADTTWALARALLETAGPASEAQELSQRALDLYRPEDPRRQELAAWLETSGWTPETPVNPTPEEMP